MNKILKLLLLLTVFAMILGGCMASKLDDDGLTSGNDQSQESEETEETEESTEAEPEPIAFEIVFHEYHVQWRTGSYSPKVIRSAEELAEYCGDHISTEAYDSEFFAENSLILYDYECGCTATRVVIEDVTENSDDAVNITVVAYDPGGGEAACYSGAYVIAINRVLTQELVSSTLDGVFLTYEEYMERFGDTKKP